MLIKLESGRRWSRREPQLIYIFFTNRNENVTHGNQTFVPTPGVEDIYLRSVFYPTVDKISRLDVNESMLTQQLYSNANCPGVSRYIAGNASFLDPPLVVYAQVGLNTSSNFTVRTPRRLYQNNSFVVGSYTVLVRLNGYC